MRLQLLLWRHRLQLHFCCSARVDLTLYKVKVYFCFPSWSHPPNVFVSSRSVMSSWRFSLRDLKILQKPGTQQRSSPFYDRLRGTARREIWPITAISQGMDYSWCQRGSYRVLRFLGIDVAIYWQDGKANIFSLVKSEIFQKFFYFYQIQAK